MGINATHWHSINSFTTAALVPRGKNRAVRRPKKAHETSHVSILSAAASASERTNAAYSAPKGYENNYQLRNGGAMTDVESSSMSVSSDSCANHVSASRSSVFLPTN